MAEQVDPQVPAPQPGNEQVKPAIDCLEPYRPKARAQSIFMAFAIAGIVAWVFLFGNGAFIDSRPYRSALSSFEATDTTGLAPRDTLAFKAKVIALRKEGDLSNFRSALFCWTPTNVGLLCILAAFVGGCASYNFKPNGIEMRIAEATRLKDANVTTKLKRRYSFMYESPLISMCRGFFAFLVLIAAWNLFESSLFGDIAKSAAQERYWRMAAVFSSVGFIMGFDPTRFEDLVDRLMGVVTTATPR